MITSLSTAFVTPPRPSQPLVRHFSDHTFLPANPQHLWQVKKGLVRTYTWDEQGNITTLGIWGKGDIVGHSLSNLTPYVIQSLGAVEVRPLNLNHWGNCEAILCHLQQLTTLLKIISIKRADERLLTLLKWLAQRFGHITPAGTCTHLPLTHQELAETANITRVTATRLIGSMEQRGILQWSRRRQFTLLLTAINNPPQPFS